MINTIEELIKYVESNEILYNVIKTKVCLIRNTQISQSLFGTLVKTSIPSHNLYFHLDHIETITK